MAVLITTTGAADAPMRITAAEPLPAERLREWPTRLEALIAERRLAPFTWGTHDCALFAADAVQALLGVDPVADWRGLYTDARGAFRALQPLGGLRGAAEAMLGPPVTPLLARVGDVGLVHHADADAGGEPRDMLAVCAGEHWLVPGLRGLVLVPMGEAVCAWRVGG